MFNITSILNTTPIKKPLLIFIRHAEKKRELIDVNSFQCNGLTKKGVNDTIIFSNEIFNNIEPLQMIRTSGVKRCVQTSRIIADNLQHTNIISPSFLLGNPGVYVKDDKIAASHFIKNESIYSIINNYIDGGKMPGMYDIEEGTQILLRSIYHDLCHFSGSTLYVSHDFILGVFIASVYSISVLLEHPLAYLEGVCFTLDKDNTIIMHLSSSETKLHHEIKISREAGIFNFKCLK